MEATRLSIEPLTADGFADFGDVIEPAAAKKVYAINSGTAQRFHDLCRVDTSTEDGRTLVSIFRAEPRSLPFDVLMLERHPLGSQAFIPLQALPYLVVVAQSAQAVPRVFLAQHGQGVNYHRGTWHHPLIALTARSDFLVIDRGGDGANCDETRLLQDFRIAALSQG